MSKPKINPLRDKILIFLGPLETFFLEVWSTFLQILVDFYPVLLKISENRDPLRGKFLISGSFQRPTYEFVPLWETFEGRSAPIFSRYPTPHPREQTTERMKKNTHLFLGRSDEREFLQNVHVFFFAMHPEKRKRWVIPIVDTYAEEDYVRYNIRWRGGVSIGSILQRPSMECSFSRLNETMTNEIFSKNNPYRLFTLS